MKGPVPWNDQVDVILSDESSSSDSEAEADESNSKQANKDVTMDEPAEQLSSEGMVIRRAEMYQDYMKQVPIPSQRGSLIPFTSWIGLSKSIKQLYDQPLHYLTNILVKDWDKMRIGSEDEDIPLDTLIHPCKAEATIWLVEEMHRLTTSHHHLAKLWLSDPRPHAFIDPIFPKL